MAGWTITFFPYPSHSQILMNTNLTKLKMKYRYNSLIFFIFIFMLEKVGKFLGTSLYWIYSLSLNLPGSAAMVAHSQAVALVMLIMKALENQSKAELEGLLKTHLIFLSHLEAESNPFSTETYLNQILEPLQWYLTAQERKSSIFKINEYKKQKKKTRICKPAANMLPRDHPE